MSTATQRQDLPAGHSRGTAYERYKKTTRAFRDCLARLLPSSMRLVSVSDLVPAVDYVLEESSNKKAKNKRMKIQQSLLTNLNETIVLREAVGATYFADADDGHRHVIQVLKYCRHVLRASLANFQSGQGVNENVSDSHNSRGRYDALGNDSDDEEDNENLSDDEQSFERPSRPVHKEYSIEKDLIIGSLAFQVNLFFFTAESLFSIVADSYKTLKQNMDDLKQSDLGHQEVNHKTTVYLMQTTAAVNHALEIMRYLEKSFFLESDHLKNIYDVFAVLAFQDKISELESVVGKEVLSKGPTLCLYFAGQCVWRGFVDGANSSLDEDFTPFVHRIFEKAQPTLSGVQLEELKEIGISICVFAEAEEMFDPNKYRNSDEYPSCTIFTIRNTDGSLTRSFGVPTGTLQWLKNYEILGGKSGIIHTLARLEAFKTNVFTRREDSERTMESAQSWRSTRQIMDTVFQNGTLPLLSDLYPHGKRPTVPGIGFWEECSTCVSFLCEFDEMMKHHRMKHCLMNSFSAAFGVHALVYAMFVLQDDNRCKRLAVVLQVTVKKFLAQVEEAKGTDFVSCLKTYQRNPLEKSRMANALLSYCGKGSFQSKSFWNSLLAGSFLLTATFSSNMVPFYPWFDTHRQTRTVLHLYSALQQREMIGQIDFLELLDRVLISNKKI